MADPPPLADESGRPRRVGNPEIVAADPSEALEALEAAGMEARDGLHTGLGFAGANFMVTGAIGIATSILMSRLFGIEVVGQNAIAFVPGGILLLLSSVREKPGAIEVLRHLEPRSRGVAGLFLPFAAFSFVLTSFVGLLVGAATWVVFTQSDTKEVLLPYAIAYLVSFVLVVNSSANFDVVFSAYGDARTIFYARVTEAVSYAVLLTLFAVFAPGLFGVVSASIASWLVGLAVRAVRVQRWLMLGCRRADLVVGAKQMRGVIMFGLKLLPGNLADGVASQVGVWVLAGRGSTLEIGAYTRAAVLSGRLADASARFSEVMQQSLMHANDEDTDHLAMRYAVGSRISWAAMLTLVGALWAVAPGVMQVFGPGFEAGSTALGLLGIYAAVQVGIAAQTDALVAMGRPSIVSAISGVGFVATIIATFPMAVAWGASGAAAGLLVGVAPRLVLNSWFLSNRAEVHATKFWKLRSRVAAGVAVTVVAIGGRAIYSVSPSLGSTVVVGMICSAIFIACAPLTGLLTRSETAGLVRLARRIANR